jgi:hypothetical protein
VPVAFGKLYELVEQKGFAVIQLKPSEGGGVQLIFADQPEEPELLEQPKPPRFCLLNSIVRHPDEPATTPGF